VIYDFAGYAGGVATTIANTTALAQPTGPTPGNIFPTDSSMTNLVFVYTGPFLAGTGTVIGTVSALSTFGGISATPTVTYASSITDNAGVPGGTDNKISAVVGPVPIIPEPGSMLLFGTGLVGLARRIRRSHAA
jgi:PEP-CTERM motif